MTDKRKKYSFKGVEWTEAEGRELLPTMQFQLIEIERKLDEYGTEVAQLPPEPTKIKDAALLIFYTIRIDELEKARTYVRKLLNAVEKSLNTSV